jgi:hypothetical protein
MNVEIGAEAALFPEKEYISGIFVAVHNTTIDPYGIEGPISKRRMEVEAIKPTPLLKTWRELLWVLGTIWLPRGLKVDWN